ncbi:MAG: hypothetical protein QG564_1820 [Campylobacterota bacterium]|nr:hypothetical protein [Campylobacterota bacterium]
MANEKNKKKVGRPNFEPTEEQRKQVETLSGFGIPIEQLCAYININDDTLRKYFSDELVKGKAKANAKIAQTLFNKATGGDTTALIFWAKTQMRWKETDKLEITGKDDGPVEISDAKQKLLAGLINDK